MPSKIIYQSTIDCEKVLTGGNLNQQLAKILVLQESNKSGSAVNLVGAMRAGRVIGRIKVLHKPAPAAAAKNYF